MLINFEDKGINEMDYGHMDMVSVIPMQIAAFASCVLPVVLAAMGVTGLPNVLSGYRRVRNG